MARDKVKLGARYKMIVRENARVKKVNQWLREKAIVGVDTMVGNSSVENRRNVKAALLRQKRRLIVKIKKPEAPSTAPQTPPPLPSLNDIAQPLTSIPHSSANSTTNDDNETSTTAGIL